MSRIVLGAGASVALYKACELASRLAQSEHAVRAVLSPRAAKLVSPQLFEAVCGEPACVDEFGADRRSAMDHIELSRWAELLVVAPATANLVARLALGLADDLLTTTALALPAGTPRLIAPAMNPDMLARKSVQRHLGTLREEGWSVLEPVEGHMACGMEGKGRLVEPAEIASAVEALLTG